MGPRLARSLGVGTPPGWRPPNPLAWVGPAGEPSAPRLTLPEAPLDAALLGGGGGVCLGTASGAALLDPLQDARLVRARQASAPPRFPVPVSRSTLRPKRRTGPTYCFFKSL